MKRSLFLTLALVSSIVSSSGCPAPVVDEDEAAALTATAQTKFPRVIDLHQKIVARSCAPNTGVCHNTNNYPELSSPSALIQSINSWCNLASPDPTQGFDMCERRGDVLASGSFRSEIASTTRGGDGKSWTIEIRDPAPRSDDIAPVRFLNADGDAVFDPPAEWGVTVAMGEGSRTITLTIGVDEAFFTEPFIDEAISGLVEGDANENGVFGADESGGVDVATTLAPGSLLRSYFWGRITGTVPGTRMPLANQALSDDEYLAVACFIEGLPADGNVDAEADIDYANCDFAKKPTLFATE